MLAIYEVTVTRMNQHNSHRSMYKQTRVLYAHAHYNISILFLAHAHMLPNPVTSTRILSEKQLRHLHGVVSPGVRLCLNNYTFVTREQGHIMECFVLDGQQILSRIKAKVHFEFFP